MAVQSELQLGSIAKPAPVTKWKRVRNGLKRSDIDLTLGPDFKKKMDDMKIKVIMGKEPIESWDAMVNSFKADANYMKMIDEFNQAFQNRKKGK